MLPAPLARTIIVGKSVMPDQRYEAHRQTIGALLSTTSPRIEVPDWQRSYSWDTSQVDTFWQDLLMFDERYPDKNVEGEEYFLGSIVLVTGGPTDLLLDGQQRLATATILLSVLRDALKRHKADAATRLQHKYIADFDDTTNTTSHVLTMNVYDRDFFRSDIQDEPTEPPVRQKPMLKSHALIRKAREIFERRVSRQSELLGGGDAAFLRNLRIVKVLCDHMSVVAVSSKDENNAAEVFETLNDRGIGLSTPDLLRNLLLRRATDNDAREQIVAAWQQVLAIDEEASVEEFLRHYWVSHYGDVKARGLYREIKDRISTEKKDSLPLPHRDSLSLSRDLAQTAPIYRDIVRAREDDPELQRILDSIRMLGTKVLYPLLLSGYATAEEDNKGADKLRLLASALVTMFVRHNVICGRDNAVMESAVFKAASELRAGQDWNSAVAALESVAPGADEFVVRFRAASVSRITTARYLLREIEHAKRKTQEVAVERPDRVHVEHIYPQSPASDRWSNHTAMINRLGNLTLLSRRLNVTIKNADFVTKKAKAYVDSDIVMTKDLLTNDSWSPAAIEARQEELSNYVFEIWHFPGEAPPTGTASVAFEPDGEGATLPDQLPEVPTG
jgi:hypothetical protein